MVVATAGGALALAMALAGPVAGQTTTTRPGPGIITLPPSTTAAPTTTTAPRPSSTTPAPTTAAPTTAAPTTAPPTTAGLPAPATTAVTEAPTTTSSTFVPPVGAPDDGVPGPAVTDDAGRQRALDASVGAPVLFVTLSLLGAGTALAILVAQWARTRPR